MGEQQTRRILTHTQVTMMIPLAGGIAMTVGGSFKLVSRITPHLAARIVETLLLMTEFGTMDGTVGRSIQGLAMITHFLDNLASFPILSQALSQGTATLITTIVIEAFATDATAIVFQALINIGTVATILESIPLRAETFVRTIGVATLILAHARQRTLVDIFTLVGILTAKGKSSRTDNGARISRVGWLRTILTNTFIGSWQVNTFESTTTIVHRTLVNIFASLAIHSQNHTRGTGTSLVRVTEMRATAVELMTHRTNASLLICCQSESFGTCAQIGPHGVIAVVTAAMIGAIAFIHIDAHRLSFSQIITMGAGALEATLNIHTSMGAVMFSQ